MDQCFQKQTSYNNFGKYSIGSSSTSSGRSNTSSRSTNRNNCDPSNCEHNCCINDSCGDQEECQNAGAAVLVIFLTLCGVCCSVVGGVVAVQARRRKRE